MCSTYVLMVAACLAGILAVLLLVSCREMRLASVVLQRRRSIIRENVGLTEVRVRVRPWQSQNGGPSGEETRKYAARRHHLHSPSNQSFAPSTTTTCSSCHRPHCIVSWLSIMPFRWDPTVVVCPFAFPDHSAVHRLINEKKNRTLCSSTLAVLRYVTSRRHLV